jgi:hypothetical protein
LKKNQEKYLVITKERNLVKKEEHLLKVMEKREILMLKNLMSNPMKEKPVLNLNLQKVVDLLKITRKLLLKSILKTTTHSQPSDEKPLIPSDEYFVI